MSGAVSGRLRVKTDGGAFKTVKRISAAPAKGAISRAVKKMMIAPVKGAINKSVF